MILLGNQRLHEKLPKTLYKKFQISWPFYEKMLFNFFEIDLVT